MKLQILIGATLAGCMSNPPSCQQAVTHYYETSKCTFIDTSTGSATSETTAENDCVQIAAAVPSECVDKYNAWLDCIDSTPANASNSACVTCTQQFMTLIECK